MNNANFLTAEWRKLAIANYVIEKDILKPFVPYRTEIDTWNNHCYVSLIGFMFLNTKLRGLAIPFHRHFEEVNLRFYVRHKENGVWKRGVTFIKEIVPKYALAFVANSLYKEHYITMPMEHNWRLTDESVEIEYRWKNGGWNRFSVRADPRPGVLMPDSKEEFITEHYWGYTKTGPHTTSQYEVQHPRWTMYNIFDYQISVDFGKLYGAVFSFLNNTAPASVMLAEGSEIAIKPALQIR